MRIVLIGQAAFGAKTLEALLENGETVVAAYTIPAYSIISRTARLRTFVETALKIVRLA